MRIRDAKFEWDDVKAVTNQADHGITFDMARLVFRDPFALDWLDESDNHGEDRFAVIGMVEERLLYVAFTMRRERARIISARLAEPKERRRYHEENNT
jgi:uncharacterized DUF497 family protein